MTSNNGIPEGEWIDVWRDQDYLIQNVGGVHGRFRHQSLKSFLLTWYMGLPEGYGTDHEMGSWKILAPKDSKNILNLGEEPVAAISSESYVFIDTNPKTAFGAVKPGTFNTPPVPLYEYSLAHYQGALKYGHYNWREDPVSTSTYINAARRHIDLYIEGQKEASDTGIHNLAHAMTCLSIVIDAEWYGTLLDDRSTFGAAQKMEEYFESKKELQLKIARDWTGHAEKLKAKLDANREKK